MYVNTYVLMYSSLRNEFSWQFHRGISTVASVQSFFPLSLRSQFLEHLHGGISTVVSLIPSLPASLQHIFLLYLHKDVFTVLFLQSQSFLLTSLLSVSSLISLLPLYGQHGYIVFEQTTTCVICDNNATFHNTITKSKDGKMVRRISCMVD